MEHISPVDRAAQIVGGMAKLARMLGVAPPTVYEWKTHKRPVPASRCPAIVRVTNGAVTLQELRPDDWVMYWPELPPPPTTPAQAATETVAGGA